MGYSSTGMRDIEFEVTLPERLYNCLADAMCKELWWRQYHELTLIVFNFSVTTTIFRGTPCSFYTQSGSRCFIVKHYLSINKVDILKICSHSFGKFIDN